MPEHNFSELYKTWPTDKLLDIVDHPNEYQPLAVNAARLELDRRQLSVEQLEEAKAIQADRQKAESDKQQRKKVIEDKVMAAGSLLIDTINPIQHSTSVEKYIKVVALVLGGLFLYQCYKDFDMLWFILSDNESKWTGSIFILPVFILPVTGVLFWLRKKSGWMLATIYFSYSAAGAVSIGIHELTRKPFGIPELDDLFPVISPTVYISTFIFFGGLTWLVCKKDIRAVYQVDQKLLFSALSIGIGIMFLLEWSFQL